MELSSIANRISGIFFALLYLTGAVFAAFFCYKMGLSQYYTKVASNTQNSTKLSQAIVFDPTNPEAYKTRGIFHRQEENYEAAIGDFEKAIILHPEDYFLWLQIGFANNKLMKFDKALEDYQRSIKLAPNYFEPQQYLGLLYLKQNNPDQAFKHLSKAADMRPELLRLVLNLAFQSFSGNPIAIENALQPKTIEAKREMANFFIGKDIISQGTIAFLTGNDLTEKEKNQFIVQLIQSKNYKLAFSIWAAKEKNKEIVQNSSKNMVLNGNFEDSIATNDFGFGWQITDEKTISLKLDNKKAFAGSGDLQIIFNGQANPRKPVITQLMVAKPNQSYKLSFTARSEELVSGGLPVVTILDADSRKEFYQSPTLTSNQWQTYNINFKTDTQTQAVIIQIQRQNCKETPCPAFGTLWLDEINLQEF